MLKNKNQSKPTEIFHEEIDTELSNVLNVSDLDSFFYIILNTLNKKAPKKQKYVRANQGPLTNKTLQKEIMKRSRLRNIFLKPKTESEKIAYDKQRNHCVGLTRKTKKDYYSNLDEKCAIDNKKLWKTVKPFLSDKTMMDDNITLVENNEIITERYLITSR